MLFLRWVIGLGCAGALGVFALILVVGRGFSAFRSADTGRSGSLLVVALPALLTAMLISVFLPGARPLLHLVAVGVAAAAAGCLWVVRTHPGEGALYLGFLSLWLLYYGLAVRARG
jgi:hypothetical protein